MKKMILIICVGMIGSILLLSGNSFASGVMRGHHHSRDGHYQNLPKPPYYRHGLAWDNHPRPAHFRPGHRFGYRYHRWYHRPFYQHGHPIRHHGLPQHTVVQEINNYYDSTESYAVPEDEFNASASVSDTGFSFSVGVKRTD